MFNLAIFRNQVAMHMQVYQLIGSQIVIQLKKKYLKRDTVMDVKRDDKHV